MLIASIFSFKMIDFKIIYIYIYDLQIEKKPLVYIHIVECFNTACTDYL